MFFTKYCRKKVKMRLHFVVENDIIQVIEMDCLQSDTKERKYVATVIKKPVRRMRYVKPPLNRLRSRREKRLFRFIRDLPDPATEQLSRDVEQYIQEALCRRHGN